MASLALSPSPCRIGDNVNVEGLDFTPSTSVVFTVNGPLGDPSFQAPITSDSSGEASSTDLPSFAVATLTAAGNAAAADVVTLGAVTYTFRASVGSTANEVLIGASASATLDNLKAAVNLTAGSGTTYGSGTTIHPTVRASTKTATTILFVAKTGGTAGNSLASTKTSTNLSFGGATFSGGAAASGSYDFQFQPQRAGLWSIAASDGTNTATASLQVFQSA